MRFRVLRLSLLAIAIGSTALAVAQDPFFSLFNRAYAEAYDPSFDDHGEVVVTWQDWTSRGRVSNVSALSESHPWDPPINVSQAMSQFVQPQFQDATLRAMSFVLSDYSGTGSSLGYEARSAFALTETVAVRTGSLPGFMINLKLAVPMHGLMAAAGGDTANGSATADLQVQAFEEAGTLLDDTSAGLQVDGNGFGAFTWSATGDWVGDVTTTTVNLPTGSEARSASGVELSSYDLLDFGWIPTDTVREFVVTYSMVTSAAIPSPDGLMALSDFSGTGGFEFQAFDLNGDPFTDFQVLPVPEPSVLVTLAVASLGLARRRRP